MKKLPVGVKYDQGKERFDLIPTRPLFDLARVYTMGAVKYDDNNWRKGMKWSRIYAAIQRHLNKFWNGEELDDESGLPHLAHAMWGCITLSEYACVQRGFDDRFKKQAKYKGGSKTHH